MSEQGKGELNEHPIWKLAEQEAAEMVKYEENRRRDFNVKTPERGMVEVLVRRMMSKVEPDVRNLNATPLTQFVISTGRATDFLLLTRLITEVPTEFKPDKKSKI